MIFISTTRGNSRKAWVEGAAVGGVIENETKEKLIKTETI